MQKAPAALVTRQEPRRSPAMLLLTFMTGSRLGRSSTDWVTSIRSRGETTSTRGGAVKVKLTGGKRNELYQLALSMR